MGTAHPQWRPPARPVEPRRLGPAARVRRRTALAPASRAVRRSGLVRERALGLPAGAVRAAAVAYGAVLLVITVLPIRWGDNWRPQLVPVWNLVVNLRDGDRPLATVAGAAGNVALFAPLGFLLPLLAPWFDRLWRTVAAGFVVSTAIELSQVAFPGIRRPDVNDMLMNTLGAAVGFLAYRLARGRGRPAGGPV
jgi:VanZ family protein